MSSTRRRVLPVRNNEKNLRKEKEYSICIVYERIWSFVERGALWEKGIDNDERMIYICF